jgi:transcriptional antiterminator RfaH
MLKLADNPPAQSPANVAIEAFEGAWWVAHTRPRQEKALAWDLLRRGGRYFLPLYRVTRRRGGRAWRTLLPLFPGYVFLCGQEADRLETLATGRVARTIPAGDQDRLVRELSQVQRLLASGMAVDAYPRLKRGAACRIRRGPLAGLEGHVQRRRDRTRFIISVTMLGQGAVVEIDAGSLEPAG